MAALFDSAANAANRRIVFNGFKLHNADSRVSTELTMVELLRETHPELHVTRTEPSRCDLHGYAAAGLAKIQSSKDGCYDALRSYIPPKSRLAGESGHVRDRVAFAQWQYVWMDHHFLIYEIEYKDAAYSPPTKLLFVLSPRNLIVEGQQSPTDQLFMAVGGWSLELHSEIFVFDDMRWTKSRELWESVHGSSWDDVILNADMKANLISDVQGFFDNRSLYKKLEVPWKRGLILHGVPGNGKTISIRALIATLAARQDSVPSLYVKSLDHCQSEKHSVRSIFTRARTMAPCLLIFEDLDSLVTDRTRSYFLNEVDGLESNDGILMIGSTNHLETLDPAISKRPSRFDRKYHFKIPDEAERIAYANFWREKLLGTDMVDFPEPLCGIIGKLAEGFSFAYLKELFVASLLAIARGASESLEMDTAPGSEDGNSSSADALVMIQKENSGPDTVDTSSSDARKEERALKRAIPDVHVPDSLRANVLLKVIRGEMRTLSEEMDSTTEESWPSDRKKIGIGGAGGMPTMRAVPVDSDAYAEIF